MEPQILIPIVACLFSYLMGSVPFGLLVARLFHVKNLAERADGDVGLIGVIRTLGIWPAGVLAFVLEAAKGALPVFLLQPRGVELWAGAFGLSEFELSPVVAWLVGLCAVIGYCYPPWFRFRGGKGIATGFGAVLLLSPFAALAGFVTFFLTFLSRRIGSLSSIAAVIMAAITHVVIYPIGSHLWAGLALVFLVLIRHEGNLDALLEDREKEFF